ncbi:MAG: carboxypeptidase-like regulatory domain-containing protein, partial [Candidatus Poseidoniia archaeon]|nr:carboxypeptidase-like regulatory domain-containing protein [Candidatus Poseidoniia archaeon]
MLAPSVSGEEHDINGSVLADGTWLVGATVTAFNTADGDVTDATTDAGGWYSLDNLESGDYKIGYEMNGYLTVVNDFSVDSSGSIDDVILTTTTSGNHSLAGNVT